jgi:hypothetical protein
MNALQSYQALPTAAPSALEPFRGLTAHTRQIFDAAPLPMLAMQVDNGSLIFADRTVLSALGLPEAGAIAAWGLLLEEAGREIYRRQLQKRWQAHNDDYELIFWRFANRRLDCRADCWPPTRPNSSSGSSLKNTFLKKYRSTPSTTRASIGFGGPNVPFVAHRRGSLSKRRGRS